MALDQKALRRKYGITMAPIPATKAYKRKMPFDHTSVTTTSYILLNEYAQFLPNGKATAGTRTHVNLYNGDTGVGYDATKNTYAMGNADELKRKLKDYVECAISDCPVATPVQIEHGGQPTVID